MIGWESLQFHELADLFPMMSVEELSDFADRIERDGFDPAHPIILFEGKVLDGRNRWTACDALRLEGRLKGPPPFQQFSGSSPLSFVLQENLHRRHLTATQKATLAVEILPFEEKEARERERTRSLGKEKIPDAAKGQARDKAAAKVGANPRYVSDAKKIKAENPDLYAQMQSGEKDMQAAKKEAKRRERPAPKPAPSLAKGKYSVIYADPPWKYDFMRVDDWAVENTYPTMSIEALCEMASEIESLCTDETVLFLWTTSPKLPWGIQLMKAWGFDYKSSMVWIKHRNMAGMGYWGRIGHELLLIGARKGASPPPVERRFPSVIEAPKGAHSEKPEEMRCIIERMFPDATRLELFARSASEGWDAWGNEVV